MNDLSKKVGYLKGLMEGMDFSNDPSHAKLFAAMADLLAEIADRVLSMEELMDDLNDYVESIDDDLAELEGRSDAAPAYGEDDDEDEYMSDLSEGEDQLHLLGVKDEIPDDAETLAGAICPECGKMFFVGAEDPEDAKYTCPHCAKHITPAPLTPENAPIARPEE